MTMSITMIQTRLGESGSLLTAGNTYSVSDAFGLAMIGAGYATDTNYVRRQPVNDAGTITSYTAAQLSALAAAGGLTPGATYIASGVTVPQPLWAESAYSLIGQNSLSHTLAVHNPRGLRRFRAAAAAAFGEYGICRINCLGDSVTLGTYSNDTSIPVDGVADLQGYVGRLRTLFARRTGSAAGGWMSANDSRNTLGGSPVVSTSIGPLVTTVRVDNTTVLGGALSLPTASTISFAVPACTAIEIVYLDSNTNSAAGGIGANTGTFSYSVDGGGSTTTTADNVNPVSYKRVSITGLSNATHTLLLTGVSGTCYIAGIFYYGATGVVVSRFGLGGATSLDLTAEGVVSHLSTGAVQRILGSMGPSAAPAIVTLSVVNGSRTATCASTAGLVAGMPIGASADLPLPNFISSVDSATQITMSAAATNTNAARGAYIGSGTTITPDLWIIPIGHNDWQNQNDGTYPVSLATFKTQMQRVIDVLVAAGGCVLLVGEPKSNNANPTPNTYPDSDYWTALAQLASVNDHVAAMQINRAWGTNAQAQALGLLSSAGGVHPLKKGSADMARLLFDALVAPQVEASPAI